MIYHRHFIMRHILGDGTFTEDHAATRIMQLCAETKHELCFRTGWSYVLHLGQIPIRHLLKHIHCLVLSGVMCSLYI